MAESEAGGAVAVSKEQAGRPVAESEAGWVVAQETVTENELCSTQVTVFAATPRCALGGQF